MLFYFLLVSELMLLAWSTARTTLAAPPLALLHQRRDGGGLGGLLPGPRSWPRIRGDGDHVTDNVGKAEVEELGDRCLCKVQGSSS